MIKMIFKTKNENIFKKVKQTIKVSNRNKTNEYS